MVLLGALAGLGIAMAGARYLQSLLYQVRLTDPPIMGFSALTILIVSIAAALPAVMRAIRTDPITVLRAE